MMRENFSIRLIDNNDKNRFVQIFRGSFKSEYLIPSIYRGLGIEKFIENELNNPFSPYRYFGSYYNNKILGCAEYKIMNNDMFFLNLIATDIDFGGKGIGKALFNYALEYFYKNGHNIIQLDVYESNIIALNWYKSLGFIVQNKKSIYKLNEVLLDEVRIPVYILNYPQYLQLVESYGFNYIDVMIENETIRLGVINNDLIIRGEYNEFCRLAACYIYKELNFKNIYYVGDYTHGNSELTLIDNILRMVLNLRG